MGGLRPTTAVTSGATPARRLQQRQGGWEQQAQGSAAKVEYEQQRTKGNMENICRPKDKTTTS